MTRVRTRAATHELGKEVRRVPDEPDREGRSLLHRLLGPAQCLVERGGRLVEIARLEPPLHARGIHFDREADALVHRDRQRLRAAHAAEPRRERPAPAQGLAAEAPRRGREGLVRSLENPLRADVDPRPGRHLAVHRESLRLERAEFVPRRPRGHEERVRDQHARSLGMRLRDGDRFSRLHEQCLVVVQLAQRADDGVERRPRARRSPRAAVDDEILRSFRHVRIEVVHQHPERCLLVPAAARAVGPARRAHGLRGRLAAKARGRGFLHATFHLRLRSGATRPVKTRSPARGPRGRPPRSTGPALRDLGRAAGPP